MHDLLKRLEDLQDDLERFDPPSNAIAFVTRELLKTLDRAHEMLKALADDGHQTEGSSGETAKQTE
jgi:hypothetical protein